TQVISFAMSNVSIKKCPPCVRTPVHHVSGTYTPEGEGTDPVVCGQSGDLSDRFEFKIRFSAVPHVGVDPDHPPISSLYLRERARVRGFFVGKVEDVSGAQLSKTFR
ncbi:hypothetical protein ACIOWE_15015, partial [Pseudomonas sp. NPDC087598]|uniref:hypothetical protein n=1 Tax=Pseudomonas sp. NPDC087598 TaxID=3364440 RepID=UPI003827BF96